MSIEPKYTFKILTIGESNVGKTCVLRRFVENKFLKTHLATIGIDFKTKNITVDDKEIKLKIWDTAGQERFRNITNQYYKGADGIILIFDITDQNSFDKIQDWINQINSNTQTDEIGLILIGNKKDLDSNRVITFKEGDALGKELGIKYFETSALSGEGIEEAFKYVAKEILKKKKLDNNDDKGKIDLESNKNRKKNKDGCC
jgi:Ras-related protein Rab-1A